MKIITLSSEEAVDYLNKPTGKETTEEANAYRIELLKTLDETNQFIIKSSDIIYDSLKWRVTLRLLHILESIDILDKDYNKRDSQFEWWVNKENPDKSKIKVSEILTSVPKNILDTVNKRADEDLFNGVATGVIKIPSYDDEDYEEDYDVYFDNLVDEIVTELDTEEQIDLCIHDEIDDPDWGEKMNILLQLYEDGRISLDFCPEHATFTFKIGERHCEIHPEHNGKTHQEIQDLDKSDDDILNSQIIH